MSAVIDQMQREIDSLAEQRKELAYKIVDYNNRVRRGELVDKAEGHDLAMQEHNLEQAIMYARSELNSWKRSINDARSRVAALEADITTAQQGLDELDAVDPVSGRTNNPYPGKEWHEKRHQERIKAITPELAAAKQKLIELEEGKD